MVFCFSLVVLINLLREEQISNAYKLPSQRSTIGSCVQIREKQTWENNPSADFTCYEISHDRHGRCDHRAPGQINSSNQKWPILGNRQVY